MRLGSLIFALWLGGLASCASSGEHSLRDHLREAIDLNESRRSRYAALALDERPEHDLSEQSEAVSDLLIRLEKKGLLASYVPVGFCKGLNFDRAAAIYQEAGIPIVHEDLVSMDEVPDIELYRPPLPDLNSRYESSFDFDSDDAAFADFETLAIVLEQEIERLSIEPRFNCMLRHVLESAARLARHAPIYLDLARRKSLRSPERLLFRMLRSHFAVMDAVMEIDRRAAPLQARGIPIVCNDVPPIPRYSERLLQRTRSWQARRD